MTPSGQTTLRQTLSDNHLFMLTQESGISEEVIASRGYWTCEDEEDLIELGFNKRQRRTPCWSYRCAG
jgi:hypothetical protein